MSDIAFPSPAHKVIAGPESIVKTNAQTNELDFIFDEETLFSNPQFLGQKAEGTNNTGNVEVHIRKDDGSYVLWKTFTPGEKQNWIGPVDGARFTKSSFKFKVATANDGIRVLYS